VKRDLPQSSGKEANSSGGDI